jgi:hypothetical protein
MSPLSALAGIGTGAMGLFQGTGSAGTGPSLFDNIKKTLGTGALNDTIFQPSAGTEAGTAFTVDEDGNSVPVI